MPYTTDFNSTPTQAAFDEAKKYKIREIYRIYSLGEIKQALRQGYPVIAWVKTDSIFYGGRFDVYTKHMRENANFRNPHGDHAMVIVGYDDDYKGGSLLFMNSWGKHWSSGGFCWVSYNAIKIGRGNPKENMIQLAVYPVDEMSPDAAAPIDRIQAVGRTWYAGTVQNHPTWYWKVFLQTNTSAMQKIQSVKWNLAETLTPQSNLDVSNAGTHFELFGTTQSSNAAQAIGTIYFKDGTTDSVEYTLQFDTNVYQTIQFIQTDTYYGKMNNRPYWEWTLKIDGSTTNLHDIQQVTYHLHPTFSDPSPVVTGTPQNGFAFTRRGWGTFEVGATILFKNGSTKEFSIDLQFSDPIQDELILTNTANQYGYSNGKAMYHWTAFIDGPLKELRRIIGVRYYLHPTFQPSVVDITERGDFGFPLSKNGWGTFPITARVFYNDNSYSDITHQLVF